MNIEDEINLINDIIDNAVSHGGDGGGSYDSNGYDLESSIRQWLDYKGLSEEYTVAWLRCDGRRSDECKWFLDDNNNYKTSPSYFDSPQIIKKSELPKICD
jgi:hypothetical protein